MVLRIIAQAFSSNGCFGGSQALDFALSEIAAPNLTRYCYA
jgi:hypothetical protein